MREKQTEEKQPERKPNNQAPIPTGNSGDGRFDPNAEERYWREKYAARPYVIVGSVYEEYGPAYQYGWESFRRHPGKNFDAIEADLGKLWEKVKGKSKLGWNLAKYAVRDAWDRLARQGGEGIIYQSSAGGRK